MKKVTREEYLQYIEGLEKKIRRRLIAGKTQDAIKDLKFLINELRKVHFHEKADLLEMTLNQFVLEETTSTSTEPSVSPKAPQITPPGFPSRNPPGFPSRNPPGFPSRNPPGFVPSSITSSSNPLRHSSPPMNPATSPPTAPPVGTPPSGPPAAYPPAAPPVGTPPSGPP
ncbi:MAG: hypothetical protein ACTSRL_20700, partial [Candidatus Helarchaeota archaeon]